MTRNSQISRPAETDPYGLSSFELHSGKLLAKEVFPIPQGCGPQQLAECAFVVSFYVYELHLVQT